MSVSVRVLDALYGRPAVGVSACLSREADGGIAEQWRERTDDDGLISSLAKPALPFGAYRLELDLDSYFGALGLSPTFSAITIRFYVMAETPYSSISMLITPSACVTFKES
jgi:5-hydroxyisourate hydrolase